MREQKGILGQYQLWGFWNSLPGETKNKILRYFEETPLMLDYNSLFQGNVKAIPHRTPINLLNILMVSSDLELCDLFFEEFQKHPPVKTNEWYWVDTHFFLMNYSGRAYKMYLNGICDENRFINVWELENNNIETIITSLVNKGFYPVKNTILEQYLIYLEKKQKYEEVISLCESYKKQGWKNNFNKRMLRCISKKM